MRYGISRSPSPARRKPSNRGRFSFGLNAYDSSEDEEVLNEVLSSESESEDSEPEPRVMFSDKTDEKILSRLKQSQVEETLLSFQRAGDYEEPFNKWAKETRTAAFRVATKKYETNPASTVAMERREVDIHKERLKESYDSQLLEVTAILEKMNLHRKNEEARLVAEYQERERRLWQRIDTVIQAEEDRVRRQLEEEEKARKEEEERKRKEEERKKAEIERKRKEEQEKALQAEVERKKKEKEEQEAKDREEREAREKEAASKLEKARSTVGFRSAKTDWNDARTHLELVKRKVLPAIKADDVLRPHLSKARRFITPKIGQLVDSRHEIERIAKSIHEYMYPTPQHPELIYIGISSVLSKSILMQAETEVSARQVTARPLAQVCIHFLTHLPNFSKVFYARMVQRTGGWAVPITVPKPEGISEVEYKKLRGYRTEREEQKSFEMRLIGIMTLYFAILVGETEDPVPPPFSFPDFWMYFARLLSSPVLLQTDIAMQILAAAIEIGGKKAKIAWGKQFTKLVMLIYKSIQETENFTPSSPDAINERQVGAEGTEGKPARVRVILAIENVMSET
ncbi:hypothetical protein Clacol_007168 [Clathrus columnatus]|uniref:mRNA export factor GLE1 n=1 Tax=Clathrus columnatus TaxID=1419009 RepID=A0AAV5AKE1_9AGAM|nr:hypothetical protein Clacol_007168 [Clathrus columnatus]